MQSSTVPWKMWDSLKIHKQEMQGLKWLTTFGLGFAFKGPIHELHSRMYQSIMFSNFRYYTLHFQPYGQQTLPSTTSSSLLLHTTSSMTLNYFITLYVISIFKSKHDFH